MHESVFADNAGETKYYIICGAFLVIALVCALGGWAAWTQIQGAVVAQATVVVEGHSKHVQHLFGGLVSDIVVREGEKVGAGELLVRLDDTDSKAKLGIIRTRLEELRAKQARLMAERDGTSRFIAPKRRAVDLDQHLADRIWSGQEKLFLARRAVQDGQKKQLDERIKQLRNVISGLVAQRASKVRQIEIVKEELLVLHDLGSKKLVRMNRLLALQREAAKLEGERGHLVSELAKTEVQITETRLQRLEVDHKFIIEVLSELRDTEAEISELQQRSAALELKLKRTDIVAPISGIVHNLALHTIGGVVKAGEVIMEIVPEEDALVIDGRIATQDIDQIRIGQQVSVRVSSFEQRTTPQLQGIVQRVSADAMQERDGEPPYYAVRVTLPAAEIDRFGNKRLVPGMPVQIFVQTRSRTVLDYLIEPFADQIALAFREE